MILVAFKEKKQEAFACVELIIFIFLKINKLKKLGEIYLDDARKTGKNMYAPHWQNSFLIKLNNLTMLKYIFKNIIYNV